MALQLLTSSEAAERLGISSVRVRQLAGTGTLRTHVESAIGRLYHVTDVMRLARARQRDKRVRAWRRKKNRTA